VLAPYIAEMEALPDQRNTPVQAHLLMSQIAAGDKTAEAKREALEWLNRAIEHAPQSVEAFVERAHFYTDNPSLAGMSKTPALAHARQDLEAADALGTDNPHLRFSLGEVWMSLGDFDRAMAELQAIETLDEASLEKHYLDPKDWCIAKYFFASDLALRRGVPTEAAAVADETLSQLERPGHKMRVLPSAINAYVAANRVAVARQRLDEYKETLHVHHGTHALRATLAHVQAQVAQAEAKL